MAEHGRAGLWGLTTVLTAGLAVTTAARDGDADLRALGREEDAVCDRIRVLVAGRSATAWAREGPALDAEYRKLADMRRRRRI